MVKNMRRILIACYLSAFSCGYCFAVSISGSEEWKNTRTVEVNYKLNNKAFSFQGSQDANVYIFNKGADKTINIATLDWPPYVDRQLCNLGWSLQLAVSILTSKGYQVSIHFYPWVRAVKLVETGKIEILFPEYFIEDSAPSDIFPDTKRSELLVQSNKFIGGNIAFIKRKSDPFAYDGNLRSIAGKSIGVVRGYQNTPEFDAMMDAQLINVVEAVDDLQLLKLLMAKRVDLIIGDPSVFKHLVNYSGLAVRNKIAMQEGIEEVQPSLKYNHLYFAISTNYEKWKTLLDDINLALIEFDISGETQRIYDKGSGCEVDF